MHIAQKREEQGDLFAYDNVLNEAIANYPVSIIVGTISVVFSVFVLTLCGFHTYIVGLNQTTQEKLSHKFVRYPWSPFSKGFILNWKEVLLWPRKQIHSRLSLALYIKSNYPKDYDAYVEKHGLPEMMKENQVEIYRAPEKREQDVPPNWSAKLSEVLESEGTVDKPIISMPQATTFQYMRQAINMEDISVQLSNPEVSHNDSSPEIE